MGDRIHRETGGRVQAGPLAGMFVLRDEVWGDTMAAKLLGTYEKELREPVRHLIRERRYDRVVVAGCAEGYWAVGLALLLPGARVVAFEEDRRARDVAAANARANGAEERLDLRGRCGRLELAAALEYGGGRAVETPLPLASAVPEEAASPDHAERPLCLIDVEGDELDLLEPQVVPGLRRADVIVECHDRLDGAIRPRLAERFDRTHAVERIEREGRAPSKLEALRHYPDLEAYLAVVEPRSRSSGWLVMRAKRA